jgi:hypothetical protein
VKLKNRVRSGGALDILGGSFPLPCHDQANASCRNAGAKRLLCINAFSAQVTASP